MDEDQRSSIFNTWRKSKKLVNIDVKKMPNECDWIGSCRTNFGFVKYGESHIQTVNMMITELSKRGCEVGNLPDVIGIK